MIRIDGIKERFGEHIDFEERAAALLKISRAQIREIKLLKRSLDCRKKPLIQTIYSLGVLVNGKEERIVRARGNENIRLIDPPALSLFQELERRGVPLAKKPLGGVRVPVVGSGPAGLFCALTLAYLGARPLVIERGGKVEERVKKVNAFFDGGKLEKECNVQFGEGGAGTFSDGKLSTGIGGSLAAAIVAEFSRHGGGETLAAESKPHIGTNVLPAVVASLRDEIVSLGGEFYFDTRVSDIAASSGKLTALELEGKKSGALDCSAAVLAIGHSARDTYEKLLSRGVHMQPKPFAVGVRIEHLQRDIDMCQYGIADDRLPAADYKLTAQIDGRGCYTFCMCPGGEVVAAASEEGCCVVNGMSGSARAGKNANSALIVTVNEGDFGEGVMDGVAFQRKWERLAYAASGGYAPPVQTLEEFRRKKSGGGFGEVLPSCRKGAVPADINSCLPEYVCSAIVKATDAFARKIPVFNRGDSVLCGVETRTSAPLRILRGEDMHSSLKGLIPCGEGAGYAGGITSAAADGVKAALSLLKK